MCDFEEDVFNAILNERYVPKNEHGEVGNQLELTVTRMGNTIPVKLPNSPRYQIANMKCTDENGKDHSFSLWDGQCDLGFKKGDKLSTRIMSVAQISYIFKKI